MALTLEIFYKYNLPTPSPNGFHIKSSSTTSQHTLHQPPNKLVRKRILPNHLATPAADHLNHLEGITILESLRSRSSFALGNLDLSFSKIKIANTMSSDSAPYQCFFNKDSQNQESFQFLSHGHHDLTTRIIKGTQPLKQAEIGNFRKQNLHVLSTKPFNFPDDVAMLLDPYLDFFSRNLFLSALNKTNCNLRFIPKWTPEWGYGDTRGDSDPWPKSWRPTCQADMGTTIRIYEVTTGTAKEMRWAYVKTLLHEMVHALIQIYTCHCEACSGKFSYELGYDGHGSTWKDISYALQETTRKQLGFRLQIMFEDNWPNPLMRRGVPSCGVYGESTVVNRSLDVGWNRAADFRPWDVYGCIDY